MFKQTWWLAGAALLVSFLTLLTGSGGSYVVAQLVALLGFAAFCALAPRLPFVFALMVIATLAKNFAVSQVVKILLWQRADIGLQAPVETAWIVAVGTWACVAAAGLSGNLIATVHGALIEWGAVALVLVVARLFVGAGRAPATPQRMAA